MTQRSEKAEQTKETIAVAEKRHRKKYLGVSTKLQTQGRAEKGQENRGDSHRCRHFAEVIYRFVWC